MVASAEGGLVATRVLRDAGRCTFRVFADAAPAGGADADEPWRGLQVALEPYGCWFDVWSRRLVAVSADAWTAPAVAQHLVEGERRGRFRYETGRRAQ